MTYGNVTQPEKYWVRTLVFYWYDQYTMLELRKGLGIDEARP
jgi:hypothetical protein